MDIEKHTPSLTHLREFTRARSRGRATHVASDRRQVSEPKENRFPSFAYEKFLTSVIAFVDNGNRGGAMARAIDDAPKRMQASYGAAARGMTELLASYPADVVIRKQRNVIVEDADGYELVSLRVHLLFEMKRLGRVGVFMYFPAEALTEPELAIMDTAIAMAVRKIDPTAKPAIAMVRSGSMRFIDLERALSRERVAFLRTESEAYRVEWLNPEL